MQSSPGQSQLFIWFRVGGAVLGVHQEGKRGEKKNTTQRRKGSQIHTNTLTHSTCRRRRRRRRRRRQHRLLSTLRPSNGGQLGFRRDLSLAPTLRSSQGACPVDSVLERPCAPALRFSSFHSPSKLLLLFQNVSSFRAPRDACNLMM
jgi:hypothetical protein